MKTLITKIFDGENGPKIFYADYKRVQLLFSPINSFDKVSKDIEKSFKDDEGIYIFIGENEKGEPIAYIGETDSLSRRLSQHKEKIQKYNDLVFIYSNHEMRPYSKTDLLFLERKLISKFKESSFIIENSNTGQGKLPTPIEQIDLNEELDLIFKALQIFNIDIEKSDIINDSSITYLENDRNKIEVFAYANDKKIYGYLNPNNSVTIKENQEFTQRLRQNYYSVKYMESIKKTNYEDKMTITDILDSNEEYKVKYNKDITFKSPTRAVILLKGQNSNGWKEWIVKSNNQPIDQFRNK